MDVNSSIIMFYKKMDGNWFTGFEVILPTDPVNILTEGNRVNDHGWEWRDTPPDEYLDWLDSQELKIFN